MHSGSYRDWLNDAFETLPNLTPPKQFSLDLPKPGQPI